MILCLGTTPAVQRVMRFSRLQRNHVNRANATLEGAAGKFINVAKVLHALGEDALALGFAGGDRGAFLADILRTQGVPFELLPVASRTRLCTTLLDEADGSVTELVEESPPVTPADYDRLLAALRSRLDAAKAVVLSGTLAPGGPPDFYSVCVRLAGEAGLLTVLDAQGQALLSALRIQPGLVKPNQAELEKTLGQTLKSDDQVFEGMQELVTRGAKRVVVTRGSEPVLALDGVARWRVTPPTIVGINPIGSGDSFTAALTAALVAGEDLGEACRCGAAAGAANALSLMPGDLKREDYEKLLALAKAERLDA